MQECSDKGVIMQTSYELIPNITGKFMNMVILSCDYMHDGHELGDNML